MWLRSIWYHIIHAKCVPIHTTGRVDKLDTSFSRSRSSSMSSLENISTESVTCLAFADSYTKKSGKYWSMTNAYLTVIFWKLNVPLWLSASKWYDDLYFSLLLLINHGKWLNDSMRTQIYFLKFHFVLFFFLFFLYF